MKKSIRNSLILALLIACFAFVSTALMSFTVKATSLVSSDITMQKGASLYLDQDSGLKFSYQVTNYDQDKTYGMLIVPYDYLDDAEITDLSNDANDYVNALKGATLPNQPIIVEGLTPTGNVISHSIKNLYEHNYARPFFGIGFIKTGENTYEYATQNDNVRSVFEVANIALNKVLDGTSDQQDLISQYTGNADGQANTKDDMLDNFIKKGYEFVYGASNPTLTVSATKIDGLETPTIALPEKAKNIELAMHWNYSIADSTIAEITTENKVKGLARGETTLNASLGGIISITTDAVAVLKDQTELDLYSNKSNADFFAVENKISLNGGYFDSSSNNIEKNGTLGSVDFGKTYTLDENGTYLDIYFTGNNMPIVEFFADGTNEYIMNGSTVQGKSFLIDNGFAGNTANQASSSLKYGGWAAYDGYFSYGVTAYEARSRNAESYSVGSYVDENGTATGTKSAKIKVNGSVSSKDYTDFSMYSLAQAQSAEQDYRYNLGMYKDAEGYIYLDAKLYKVSGPTETLFAFWNTKAILAGNTQSATRDKLNVGETISGKIILRGGVKGQKADNTGFEPTVFTCSAPYAGPVAADPAMEAPIQYRQATFNNDGSVTLASNYMTSTQNYSDFQKKSGYVALEGKYELGTLIDIYFTGNNMPIVSFFNKYVTNNISKTYNGEEVNTGIVAWNGLCTNGGGSFDSNEIYRFRVYGPNRLYDYWYSSALSGALTDGSKLSEGTQSKISMYTLSTMPEQRFKYTIGYYAVSNEVYLFLDVDKVDANGVKTEDYYSLDKKLNDCDVSQLDGDRIILYGAYNGGTPITFSYSAPYEKP